MRTERGRRAREARTRREPYGMSVLVVALWAGLAGAGLAQVPGTSVPDNRGLKLDPDDSVPPFYRQTLDERDRQRLDAAREAGETYLPTFQGPSAALEDEAPAAAATGAPKRPRAVYEGYRRPERRAGAGAGRRCAPCAERVCRRADRGLDAPARDRPRALPRSDRPRSRPAVARGRFRTTLRPGHSRR